jgi:hypothetical protein
MADERKMIRDSVFGVRLCVLNETPTATPLVPGTGSGTLAVHKN